ncbi:MAG: MipA/OmpV family protein [Candidatus Electrothrix scaldis]|nr:MAG: MipA/OmpV family protein [Candidatus Electrothrix sp. GW3-3]
MKIFTTSFLFSFSLLFLHLSIVEIHTACAQPRGGPPTFSLGTGVVFSTTPYLGADTKTIAIPMIMFSGEQFFIRGTGAGLHIYQDEQFSLDLLGKYRFNAYEAGDSPDLVGIKDREGTVEAGLGIDWRFKQAVISGKVFTDLLDKHGGQEIKLRIKKPFRWRMLFLAPYLGVSLRSDAFSTYYYGVDATEAIAGRAKYELDWTTNWQAGLVLRIGLNQNIMLNTLVGLEILDQEVEDSPIIEQGNQFFAMFGLAYGF